MICVENKSHEGDINYIVVSLCRGLADYDANEIVPTGTAAGDPNTEGHHNDSAD